MPALVAAALASCGAGTDPANQANADHSNGGGPVANDTLTKFALTSDDFQDGQPIPQVHSCDGSDQSPALSWEEPPPGTKSFTLIMDDPDAPNGTFGHWAAYDIPPTARSLPRGEAVGKQATNDFGKTGYGGPCPPKGHGVHHYHFKLYALDVDGLTVAADAKVEQVEQDAQRHAIAKAEIVGTFERQ